MRQGQIVIKKLVMVLFSFFMFAAVSSFILPLEAKASKYGIDQDMWMMNGVYPYDIKVDEEFTYVGGYFYSVAPQDSYTGKGVVLDTATAAMDTNFPKVNGDIRVSVSDGSGGWYIAGSFSRVGDYERNNIAHIGSDGSVDSMWNPNAIGTVFALAISGNEIYVGGNFTTVGGQSRNRIAKLNNTTGAADVTWNPNASSYVLALAISGGDIYAGGYFTTIGGQSRNYIAKLNDTTGAADATWNPNASSYVYTLAIYGSDIYAGGVFTTIGGQSRNRIAKLNDTTGAADATWNPDADNTVRTLAISGSDIYAGGYFTTIGGQSRDYIAKLNDTTGAANAAWNPDANDAVRTLAISGSDIYAGGYFTTIGGQSRNRIAKLNNTTGAADSTWDSSADYDVYTLSIYESKLYVGGSFMFIGKYFEEQSYLARFSNETGELDLTWNPEPSSMVNTIDISGDDIYVGGSFTSIGGQPRNRIAKLNNTTGAADPTWDPNASSYINTIIVDGDDIYVGGNFTSIGGQSRNRIAKLNNTTGAADVIWNPDANNYIDSIAISGSDIYAGGNFTTIGVQSRNRIAKLNNTTGAADATWDANANGRVATVAITENDIYVGGDFTTIGGQLRNRVAKLNDTTGAADLSWDPNLVVGSSSPAISTIATSGEDIYIGGEFSSIGGHPAEGYAKVNNTTGEADISFDLNAGGIIYTCVILPVDEDIYIGGNFIPANMVYFAKVFLDTEAPTVSLATFVNDTIDDSTPTFTGTAVEYPGVVASMEFQMDGTDGAWIACMANDGAFDEATEEFTCMVTEPLSEGEHTIYIKAADDNGNVSEIGNLFSYRFLYLELPVTGQETFVFLVIGLLVLILVSMIEISAGKTGRGDWT